MHCQQSQTPICFPAVLQGLILEKDLYEWARRQEAIAGVHFTKKWRVETLQPGLEFDNFKPRLKICIFKYISWLNGSLFGMIGVFWKRESRHI